MLFPLVAKMRKLGSFWSLLCCWIWPNQALSLSLLICRDKIERKTFIKWNSVSYSRPATAILPSKTRNLNEMVVKIIRRMEGFPYKEILSSLEIFGLKDKWHKGWENVSAFLVKWKKKEDYTKFHFQASIAYFFPELLYFWSWWLAEIK